MAYLEQTNLTDEAGVVINPATEESASDNASLLRRMLNVLLAPLGYDKSLQRYRQTAILESGTVTTVTTVNTVSTVTNLTNINGNIGVYQATQQVYGQNLAAWNSCVRSRIT
jgi:hypothetical protein